jgi:hypothetical protein
LAITSAFRALSFPESRGVVKYEKKKHDARKALGKLGSLRCKVKTF